MNRGMPFSWLLTEQVQFGGEMAVANVSHTPIPNGKNESHEA
jgi:hypothetical protein